MRKILLSILLLLWVLLSSTQTSYGSCGGVLTNGLGNWTVASNCTISWGIYSVWWVIDVSSRTVTIASDAALVVDWKDNRMTFTTGKVLMSWNGTIHDSQLAENGGNNPYGANSWVTNCPSGTSVWNPITNSSSSTRYYASQAWRLICK
jgi:hypothetical protein